jgi:hypothetical protein
LTAAHVTADAFVVGGREWIVLCVCACAADGGGDGSSLSGGGSASTSGGSDAGTSTTASTSTDATTQPIDTSSEASDPCADCPSGVCQDGVCCTESTYDKSTGLISGSAMVCCDGDDMRVDIAECGTGVNYSIAEEGENCASTTEGAMNGGAACVTITCRALDCGGDEPPPWNGPAGPEVWTMAGVFVYDPKTFDPATYGPVLAERGFGWVALQIVDGSTEKWPCAAEPCGTDTARGWIEAWRAQIPWVGAWGVNRANADQASVEAEAQVALDLLDAYDGAQAYVDFFIADAEAEYEYSKCGACVNASDWWSARFRSVRAAGTFEAAVSSYGRTDLADVYWMSWRDRGFAFLPQTYWNDPNAGAAFAPALGVDYAEVCPGSQSASDKGLDCNGSPTDCPCWDPGAIHPTIGFGWGSNPPTEQDYVDSLVQAGSVGFSIFEGQYIPADSAAWSVFGDAIANQGIAVAP